MMVRVRETFGTQAERRKKKEERRKIDFFM